MARDITQHTRNRTAKAAARIIHSRVVQDVDAPGTPYRRAMNALADQMHHNGKTMKPETRRRLALEKDELRRLTGNTPTKPKGDGAPTGHYTKKEKAKSRRSATQPFGAPNKPRR